MSPRTNPELNILYERLRALETLMRYERSAKVATIRLPVDRSFILKLVSDQQKCVLQAWSIAGIAGLMLRAKPGLEGSEQSS